MPVAKLSRFSGATNPPRALNPTGVRDLSRYLSSGLLTPTPWQLSGGLTARCVSLSVASHGGTDPLGSPSAPAESDPPDQENFGSLSADMSSRRSYRKDGPYLQDLRYREDEEDLVKPRRRPGRRNTPYWYFLQCKKLIKENKVSLLLQSFTAVSVFCYLSPPAVCKPSDVSSDSCRRLWTCSAETCCRGRGCSRRSSTTLS